MKPYIKICGVTNDQDLKELIKLDIDAIGFNRDKDSPRYVSFEFLESSGKCFNEKISPVIVFVNESKEGIKKAISYFKNPILQFHGDESQDFCASFNLPYIKAISMNEKDFQNKILEFGDAFAILLDSGGQKIRGGTGKTFDWNSNSGNYTLSGKLQEYFKRDEGSGSTLTNSANGGNATKQSGSGSWDADATQIGTSSATGNFISNVITASASTNKMGVVITYTDTSGTATLNTDLKVSLSADNGSNFTQVTLVAQPNFATGVKMALANDVTVTAGTQLKYKVEFANQAVGSKETRVTGVSLQY